jgi:phage shock protein A
MGLFQRISDIISANLHEMVERFEDPQAMLKQAIREMEQAIALSLDKAVEVIASEKLLARQAVENRQAIQRWQAAAHQAVAANDDTSARRALARKAEHYKLLAALEAEQQAAEQTANRLRRQIAAMRAKLAEARRRLATLSARQHMAATRRRLSGDCLASDDAGFARFERRACRVDQAEAEADAYEELCGSWDASADEEESLEIERELAELKASVTT